MSNQATLDANSLRKLVRRLAVTLLIASALFAITMWVRSAELIDTARDDAASRVGDAVLRGASTAAVAVMVVTAVLLGVFSIDLFRKRNT
jgi:hypothetical protein